MNAPHDPPAYDVVIATRNRPAALALSVPRILAQSHRPGRIVLVDASDDPAPAPAAARRAMAEHAAGRPVPELVVRRCRANLPAQRNVGLIEVRAPVVMFPDDDGLWHDGVAEAMLDAYARDTGGLIGGVCGRPIRHAPPGSLPERGGETTYRLSSVDRLRQLVGRRRHKLDDRLFPDPLWVYGRLRRRDLPAPDWLGVDVKPVDYMGGYRMSFRTAAIREAGGFDEELAARVPFTGTEDADASFRVLRRRLVVCAERAAVYHHRFPARRSRGFEMGLVIVLNRAYVLRRHAPADHPACAALRRFAASKLVYGLAEARSAWGRERVRGLLWARRRVGRVLAAADDAVHAEYAALFDEGLSVARRLRGEECHVPTVSAPSAVAA